MYKVINSDIMIKGKLIPEGSLTSEYDDSLKTFLVPVAKPACLPIGTANSPASPGANLSPGEVISKKGTAAADQKKNSKISKKNN